MAGSIKGIIVEIGGDTSGLQKALSKVNSVTSGLSKELKQVNSLLKLDPKNTELLAQKQTLLTKSIETTEDKLKQLQKIKEEADKKMAEGTEINEENYRALQREIINTENKLNGLTENYKKFQTELSKLNQAGENMKKFGEQVNKVSGKIDNLGNQLTTKVTSGIVGLGTVAIATSATLEQATDKYIATTEKSIEETEKYRKVLTNIHDANFGEGYEDIANSMAIVEQQMRDLNDATELENITKKAYYLKDAFDAEINESVRAAKMLMEQWGVSADEAFELINQGYKKGLDRNGDFLDSINEYSVHFRQIGLTATDMLNTFKLGADEGAFSIDKIGDAVKEMGIRLKDGTATDALKTMKLNAKELEKAFAEGGEKGSWAFGEIVKGLESIKDPLKQNEAGVAIFGTMWEDLGKDAVFAMTQYGEEFDETLDTIDKSMDNLYSNSKNSAETSLKRLKTVTANLGSKLLPTINKVLDKANDLVDSFNNLSEEEQENIIKIGLMVASAGPLLKIVGTLGKTVGTTVKGIGTFTKAIGVARGSIVSTETSVNNLAKVLKTVFSPTGAVIGGIAIATGVIISEMKKAEEQTKNAFTGMAESATDYYNGIQTAESYLSSFNSTMFASAEEQQNLQENMEEVQAGITAICKKASDERRDYTQEEITQLDEYFNKLRELKDRELEIQMQISGAITQQAKTNSENFTGSLEEYQVLSQKWIKTAQDQANAIIDIAEQSAIEETALLNQKYATEEARQTEAYQAELKSITDKKQQRIALAQEEVAEVTTIYAQEYTTRSQNESDYLNSTKEVSSQIKAEKEAFAKELIKIQTIYANDEIKKEEESLKALEKYQYNTSQIWREYAKNMDEAEADQLGSWLALQATTEIEGGKLTEETQLLVSTLIESYDSLPEGTRNAMKNAMTPMLEEMEKTKPELFAKASGIAGGILSRLRTAFDIHSPSRETRDIFQNVMKRSRVRSRR